MLHPEKLSRAGTSAWDEDQVASSNERFRLLGRNTPPREVKRTPPVIMMIKWQGCCVAIFVNNHC